MRSEVDSNRGPIPTRLRMISISLQIVGFLAILGFAINLARGSVLFEPLPLCFFAGRGLKRRSVGWRTFTLFVCWLVMISAGVVMISIPLTLLGIGQAPVIRAGDLAIVLDQTPHLLLAGGVVLVMGLCAFWAYRVLIEPSVQAAFSTSPNENCKFCGYSLRGLSVRKCPECGNLIARSPRK